MKTNEELNALKNEIEVLNKKLAVLREDELGQVIGGGSQEIADILVNGLLDDKGHPVYVMSANSKDPKSAQRSENCSNFLQDD